MLGTNIAQLPAQYVFREPTEGDIPAILALLDDFEMAACGQPAGFNAEDIREGWANLNVASDAWFVAAPDGSVAGYGEITDFGFGRLVADCYVHPNHEGRGIGTALVRLTEARARQLLDTPLDNTPADARVVIENNVVAASQSACELLERADYTAVRYFSQMQIELAAPPEPPRWPHGIVVRPFKPGRDEHATFEAVEEAFSDHWGHTPQEFDDWIKRTRREDFDPSLWWLAEDAETGGELAGVALCRNRGESGWVNTLAVRRPWRKRGLGMALLLRSFGEFYRRGRTSVGLGVDAASLTGATRLYERAGMRAISQAACYQKVLRPGVDLGVRDLGE
jgi:mycothiol synthase